ncbi:hypothetical protein [Candidatus Palauibacter sp.]|uniref:hypothetical protein n=1 Tax=Candidatus Palauibacter sp. TaxID=3101350 RepID=UPI003D1490E4
MSCFRLFSLAVSRAAGIRMTFAARVALWAMLSARPSRRVVAVGLLLTILIPFVPLGHAHAETVGHEADDVPAVETGGGEGKEEAAAVHGCSRYITTGSSRPGRGVLTLSICSLQSMPGTFGLVSCEFCTCWYRMHDGRTVNLNQVDCGGPIVIISNPSGDECGEDVC